MKHLSKLLDYATFKNENIIPEIAKHLSLEIFEETEPGIIYTLASDHFVLDIFQDKTQILFVDETLNSILKHVDDYFNHFYSKRDYKTLYFLLRYLTLCKERSSTNKCDIENNKGRMVCDCLFSEEPSVPYCFDDFFKKGALNIFNHSADFNVKFVIKNGENAYLRIGSDLINVVEKDIFINGNKNGPMSYLYKKGYDLEFCYKIIND